MLKRSLLATTIALVIAQQASAAPLLPIDARGLAMGSTGVASAKLVHAPQYNPALLSTAKDTDTVAVSLPQLGVIVSDEEEMIDVLDDLSEGDYKTGTNGESLSLIDYFEDITDNIEDILINDDSGIETQLNELEALIDNVEGNGGNDSTTSSQLTSATNTLNTSAQSLNGQTGDLKDTTFDLTDELSSISGRVLRGSLGINGAIAIPNETFSAAISVSSSAFFSGRLFFSDKDKSLLNGYADAINQYSEKTEDFTQSTQDLAAAVATLEACSPGPCGTEQAAVDTAAAEAVNNQEALRNFNYDKDGRTILTAVDGDITLEDELDSNVQVIAVGITDIGLTLSRSFKIADHDIAIGITPKLQTIKTFNYVETVENEDLEDEGIESGEKEIEFADTEQDFSAFNLDIGAAYQFGGTKQWQVGVVAKNLLSKTYKAESNANPTTGEKTTANIDINTQFRAGISHTTDWTVVALDLDLIENDPVAFEAATQYASIGAELDLLDLFQLRAGYRTNLSASDASVASIGLGFSPFGAHLDIAAMANPAAPEKEVGVAMELGFNF